MFCHSMVFIIWKMTALVSALSLHGWKMGVFNSFWVISPIQIGFLWSVDIVSALLADKSYI